MHLKANTEYVFFVRSVSPEGAVSGPSPFSIPVTTHHSGSRNTELEAVLQTARNKLGESIVVILKNVYATASTSIRIEWQVSKIQVLSLIHNFQEKGFFQYLTFCILTRSCPPPNLWKVSTFTTGDLMISAPLQGLEVIKCSPS